MELVGEPPALSAFRQALRRWLGEAGADDDEVQDIVMAVNEACQNAIEHAYGLTPEPFTVLLEARRGRGRASPSATAAAGATGSPTTAAAGCRSCAR